MQAPVADFMDARQRADLIRDLRGLVSDRNAGRQVTFYARTARSYSPGTGRVTMTETTTTIVAAVHTLTDAEIASGGYVRGDLRLLVNADDLASDPDVYDRLTLDGVAYTVLDRATDAIGAVHQMTARKAA